MVQRCCSFLHVRTSGVCLTEDTARSSGSSGGPRAAAGADQDLSTARPELSVTTFLRTFLHGSWCRCPRVVVESRLRFHFPPGISEPSLPEDVLLEHRPTLCSQPQSQPVASVAWLWAVGRCAALAHGGGGSPLLPRTRAEGEETEEPKMGLQSWRSDARGGSHHCCPCPCHQGPALVQCGRDTMGVGTWLIIGLVKGSTGSFMALAAKGTRSSASVLVRNPRGSEHLEQWGTSC